MCVLCVCVCVCVCAVCVCVGGVTSCSHFVSVSFCPSHYDFEDIITSCLKLASCKVAGSDLNLSLSSYIQPENSNSLPLLLHSCAMQGSSQRAETPFLRQNIFDVVRKSQICFDLKTTPSLIEPCYSMCVCEYKGLNERHGGWVWPHLFIEL